jgi:hypothetical protein
MWQNLFLLMSMLLASNSVSMAQWTLEREENGIKVYTAQSGTSSVKSVKVEGTFKGTCDKVITVFRDIENQKRWVYATKQAYLIEKVSDNEFLYYVETALPWPAKNRDAVVRMHIEKNASGTQVKIRAIGEPEAAPEQKGKVRVPEFKGIWQVATAEEGKIHIEYILDLNPGGGLPASAVNLFVYKGPYESLVNLGKLLEN